MANYYHEARAHTKKLKQMQEEGAKRRDRRQEAKAEAGVVEDPTQSLVIDGRSSRLHRNIEQHAALERGDGLIPWNGAHDNMIDRFDGRSLLDFYRDPPRLPPREKSHQEEKLEQALAFEAFRDVIRLTARGLSGREGIAAARAEHIERRANLQAQLQAVNQAAFGIKPGGGGSGPSGPPAGTGAYSAVGFSYGGAGGGESSSDEDSDSDDGGVPETEADAAQEAEDDRVDDIAAAYGLGDFTYQLHKVLEQEGDDEARMRARPRRRYSRKKASARARRMAGQGLDPATGLPWEAAKAEALRGIPLKNPWLDSKEARRGGGGGRQSPERFVGYGRRNSPSYEAPWQRGRSRSRSRSPPRGGTEFITSFSSHPDHGPVGGGPSGGAAGGAGGIVEALPDRPDPAMLGGMRPVALDALKVHGVRPEEARRQDWEQRRAARERERERSRSRDRGVWGRSASRSRSRSRSRDRGRRRREPSRSRSRDRDRSRRGQRRSRSRSCSRDRRSRSRSRDRRRRSRSRSRSGERERRRDSGRTGGSGGGAGAGGGSSKGGAAGGPSASGAKTPTAAAAAAAAPAKETPQERLKRIMAAQINKAFQRDSLAAAQKKLQAEKEKVAREQMARSAYRRSPSPGRRSRSRSPPRLGPRR